MPAWRDDGFYNVSNNSGVPKVDECFYLGFMEGKHADLGKY